MGEFKRNERVGAIIKILCDNPNRVLNLNYFSTIFDAAKSTISEDMVIVKKLMDDLKFGNIETLAGAGGGVRYLPHANDRDFHDLREEITGMINDGSRIILGGYIYLGDIMCNPHITDRMGRIFASRFISKNPQYVVTVETKGIPVAIMTARYLNVPLVIVRKENKVTEGSTLSINYVSGSDKKIRTMALSRRAIKENSRVVIVDDFMKAGGTAKALIDLMAEFKSKVEGIGVAFSTKEPHEKLVEDYFSLITLGEIHTQSQTIEIL